MESSHPAGQTRERLKELRDTVLALHKAILDSERTAYELVHGHVASPGAFLQLLISDSWFAWLKPVTTLIVQIDETLTAKNPLATDRELEQLIGDTHALLSPSREATDFWGRYSFAVQRDPGVALLHSKVEQLFNDHL
ncbi:MAG: hypothetical protein M3Y57_06345 [Acidobacteriota bacterium]|nr:hypothetical protein [Acidobacteriota bacterium]